MTFIPITVKDVLILRSEGFTSI